MESKVKIIIGSHGSGKSDWLYNRFLDNSRNKDKTIDLSKKFILVVPEQDTNDKQRLMMKMSKEYGYGILNIDVVSFDRIAHNTFDRLGIEPEDNNVIDDSGKTMVLSQVLYELSKSDEDKLEFYGKMANKMGFAKKMTQAMSEFYAYNVIELDDNDEIIVDNIKKVIDSIGDKNDLMIKKLSDLRKIYIAFVKKLKSLNFSIKETKYDLLNKVILEDAESFKHAVVAFEGFTGFTPIQLSIFGKIVDIADETYVVIDYRKKDANDTKFSDNIKETDVFYLSKKFVNDINKKLMKSSVPIEADIVDYNKENVVYKYQDRDDLKFLEENIYNYVKSYEALDITPEHIEVYEAKNVDDEITNAAHIILHETQKNDSLRYSDIKIVVPQVEDYSDKILNIFSRYNIPVFLDNSKSILNSPYIETIRAALDVVAYNFSYDSVMRYINSGIFEKYSDIYMIDNFIREYGIRGANRYRTGFEPIFDYRIDRLRNKLDDEKDDDKKNQIIENLSYENNKKERMLKIKSELFDPLLYIYDEINKSKSNMKIKDYIKILKDFEIKIDLENKFNALIYKLENIQLSEDIEKENKDYKNKNLTEQKLAKLSKRRSYYNRFGSNFQLNVLNKSVDIKKKVIENIEKIFATSDENIELSEFRNLFDVGFNDVEIKTLPQELDQIVVGDLMRSRFDNPKIQICLGFNQSTIPAETNDVALIDDYMRDEFKKIDIDISQTTYETALNQRLYIYLTLTNPTDKLILSYPRLNISKTSDIKSTVILAVENLFGKNIEENGEIVFKTNLKTRRVDKYSLGYFSVYDLYDYIAENMQNLRREYDNKVFVDDYNIDNLPVKKAIKYLNDKYDNFKDKFNFVFNRLTRDDDKVIDKNLIGDILDKSRGGKVASVSYIEAYNACPYKHFLEKTIHLSERRNYDIKATDLGTYLHRILELFYHENSKDKIDDLIKNKELDKKIEECIDKATEENFSFQDLKNNKDIYYGENKLKVVKLMTKRIIRAAIRFINFANDDSKLNDVYTEESFETDIKYTDKDKTITFVGKVDKIESFVDNDNVFVNVIDYKSGKNAKTISIKDIENGKTIQLVLYLDYCKNIKFKGKQFIPCGAFYIWLEDPIIKVDSEEEIVKVRQSVNKSLAYVGIANDDVDIINKIKPNLVPKSRGKGYEDKDTGFTISGEVLKGGAISKSNTKNKEFDVVMDKVREVIKNSMEKIEDGEIDAKPIDYKTCDYCPYTNICMKDKIYADDSESNNEGEN